MRENIREGGAVYIPVGETSDTLADASEDKLRTYEARMSPPTNKQTVAHTDTWTHKILTPPSRTHTSICQTTAIGFPSVAMLLLRGCGCV